MGCGGSKSVSPNDPPGDAPPPLFNAQDELCQLEQGDPGLMAPAEEQVHVEPTAGIEVQLEAYQTRPSIGSVNANCAPDARTVEEEGGGGDGRASSNNILNISNISDTEPWSLPKKEDVPDVNIRGVCTQCGGDVLDTQVRSMNHDGTYQHEPCAAGAVEEYQRNLALIQSDATESMAQVRAEQAASIAKERAQWDQASASLNDRMLANAQARQRAVAGAVSPTSMQQG